MAGMDWFRWHHGSVTDPKFQLVAKKAGVRPADVLAVWACLLEEASQAEDRGNPGTVDFDSLDCLLGFEDGTALRIYERMKERALFTGEGRIEAWERRQPKREREGDDSTNRVKAFRERKRQETPGNAKDTEERQETPREEKSREEKKGDSVAKATGVKPPKLTDPKEIIFGYGLSLLVNAGTPERAARSFLGGLDKAHGSEKLIDKLRECAKAKPLQPLEWLAAALPPPKKGERDKSPPWCKAAGFENVHEAGNAGCYEHTAAQFSDGKRLEAA